MQNYFGPFYFVELKKHIITGLPGARSEISGPNF